MRRTSGFSMLINQFQNYSQIYVYSFMYILKASIYEILTGLRLLTSGIILAANLSLVSG